MYIVMDFKIFLIYKIALAFTSYIVILQYIEYQALTLITILLL
jgi:hypothetical protein